MRGIYAVVEVSRKNSPQLLTCKKKPRPSNSCAMGKVLRTKRCIECVLKTGCCRRIGIAWALGVFHHRDTINGIKKKNK